jgi:hypothetical protein
MPFEFVKLSFLDLGKKLWIVFRVRKGGEKGFPWVHMRKWEKGQEMNGRVSG